MHTTLRPTDILEVDDQRATAAMSSSAAMVLLAGALVGLVPAVLGQGLEDRADVLPPQAGGECSEMSTQQACKWHFPRGWVEGDRFTPLAESIANQLYQSICPRACIASGNIRLGQSHQSRNVLTAQPCRSVLTAQSHPCSQRPHCPISLMLATSSLRKGPHSQPCCNVLTAQSAMFA
jgi:hypothetical protein